MIKRSPFSILLRALLTLAIWFLIFWFALPAINFASSEFRFWLIAAIVIAALLNFAPDSKSTFQYFEMKIRKNSYTGPVIEAPRAFTFLLGICIALVVVSFVITCIGAPIFNASAYHDLINVTEGDFTEDVAEIGMNSIPVVDRATANRLGSRKLGEISDMISQFEIESDYTQINYKGVPTRVTPLVYADPIRWLYNMRDGIPAYITVNLVTQETDLVRLDQGIKYSRGDYFMRNIDRYLRFNYPTRIFDEISFEIDDNGVPYWVAPTINYEIMLWSGKNIDGAVLVNAVTGESRYYAFDEIPSWVDQVCISELVVQHLNYYGLYGSGFINSIFGQRGVLATTEGYNYLALEDDVYLYTGLTSVLSDESNIGFVLVNLRTKETKFYTVPGAEEYSAMSSAEGQVQNLKYKATFPILLNIAGRPTYFLSLKDNAELVKMYAFVDVEQYQIVATGVTVAEAQKNYVEKLKSADVEADIGSSAETTAAGSVSVLSPVVISGTTGYYFKLAGDEAIYFASITVNDRLAFLAAGDSVEVTYTELDGLREVTEILWK
ncbi:MAG: CvpA family protein [Clostridia bacterium]|nr:CvpA family protein [Clostridia bacterium]